MPSASVSQARSKRPGNGSRSTITVPQYGCPHTVEFTTEPIVTQKEHPLHLKEWQQLEESHIRYGAAHGLDTVGTTCLTGEKRRDYQVKLGVGTQGQELLYRPDVILHAGWDTSKWILIEDKWQNKGGSCEAKVFEVWWNLHQAISFDDRVVAAYLILDGPGWSEKNSERFKLMLSTMPSTVRVFFSDDEFLRHGIPEAWLDPELHADITAVPQNPWNHKDNAQLRLA